MVDDEQVRRSQKEKKEEGCREKSVIRLTIETQVLIEMKPQEVGDILTIEDYGGS